MIIKSATRLVFAAGCLTAIATLPAAHAQLGGGPAPGTYGYGPPPGAYGYGPAPGAYGYGPPPGGYGYGSPPGAYAPQSQHVAPPPSAGTAGAQVITNGQTNPGDVSPSWSAQRNVTESEGYERLLKGNPAFRQARMRKECGPITDPQLHRQCLDSFAH